MTNVYTGVSCACHEAGPIYLYRASSNLFPAIGQIWVLPPLYYK